MAIDFEERARSEEAGGARLRSAAEPSPRDPLGFEQAARDEWCRNAAIRLEFGQFERYVAFKKADAKGLVKIFAPGKKA